MADHVGLRGRVELSWSVGFVKQAEDRPQKMVPATVPGAVQLDWARAEGWGDPAYINDVERFAWMEDVHWLYRAMLPPVAVERGQRLYFVCGGVDYRFQVRVGGKLLHEQEGMFTPVEIDLTEAARADEEIEVLVFPVPKSHNRRADRHQANQSCKPAVSYGWDFHPRLVPLGIWDETYLEVRPQTHLRRAEVFYELSEDLTRAQVRVEVEASGPGAQVRWRLVAPDGHEVLRAEGKTGESVAPTGLGMRGTSVPWLAPGATVFRPSGAEADETTANVARGGVSAGAAGVVLAGVVENPRLWWPNGQGEQAMYQSVVELLDETGAVIDRKTARVGLRRVKLVMHPTQWDDPDIASFPKTRNKPPITLEINGRRIFAKGSNWVSPDIFPGRISRETYLPLLKLAQEAHMNLLRCWGGAPVQKDAFFELCDELGLMVWQEFPLACNRYEGTPHYLKVLDQESRSIIQRLRPHACVVMWCGGNELFNAWSRMTDQDLALRLLNHNCFALDPHRPFLMTSPVMGMGHGSYLFRREDGREVFQYFHESRHTAYTEFGVPGPSDADILRRIIPEAQLFPPQAGTAWEVRHAFKAWAHQSWLEVDRIAEYFGTPANLEQLVEGGQLLQSEGLKCIFEEARRQKPGCAMALNWCLNEPWPSAAGSCVLSWPARPKPGYHAVKDASRPALASARIPKFLWKAGELLEVDLWLLNDAPEELPAGRVEACLIGGGQELLLLRWDHAAVPANQNLAGPTVRIRLPHWDGEQRIKLVLRAEGRPQWDSQYVLVYRGDAKDRRHR